MYRIATLLLALLLSLSAFAEAPEEGDEAVIKPTYYSLVPALVGNYGTGERLKYYKADISLKVMGPEAEAKVEHHEPLIRNQLIMLFSQQTDDTLATVEAKEALRQEALKQVRQVLEQEEGQPLVEDLLFNNLILQ
ncbi:flagellar basal body-associated protein FliL [Stutzerimonas urumqiensis]|uniref:flagellar basal body-associated protein FliL n=1 Tax=Stutzerimonas urumqiensis TaxID=638269 RepID=UPI000EB058D5|nr:flagellar basal body-associated protein FliL [Stutzerimonas urumqiensis]